MTAEHLSSALMSMGPALANHLWQSTVFAAVAGLLTRLLRKHQARIRFAVWLAASIKFLVPFSLLIALGGLLPKPQHVVAGSRAGLYAAMDVAGQPFSVGDALPIRAAAPAESLLQRVTAQLPLVLAPVLAGIWLFGASVVLLVWLARWRQVYAILRRTSPIHHGREIRLLRRLEEATGRQGRMALCLSPDLMEPGVFGIARPVLIWPERLSERLDEEQMEAILAHEMTHQRRHDNLAAAIHMLVEVLFWFHPMVWWMERRMVEERELACDEAVVRLGSSPEAYAEGLLKACRFCVEAPLACVSGITGADLSRRVRAIMTLRLGRRLGLKGKLLLLSAASLATIAPVMIGLWHRPTVLAQTVQPAGQAQVAAEKEQRMAADAKVPAFDAVSIKPHKAGDTMMLSTPTADGYTGTNVSVQELIRFAYGLKGFGLKMDDLVLGAPKWAAAERFDIAAKMDGETTDRMKKLSNEERYKQMKLMMQGMLAERFGLKVHPGTKEIAAYALVVAKGGFKLKEADPKNTYAKGIQGDKGPLGAGWITMNTGKLTGQGIDISLLAANLGGPIGSYVEDKTGIGGKYDISLQWDPDPDRAASDGASSAADNGPSLYTELQDKLGLKLVPAKVPMDTAIIDHVDRPSAN